MKPFIPLLILSSICLLGCSSIHQKEQFMSAAGFRTVIPSTPAQIAQLKTLPQGKVIPVVKKGKTVFLFADASNNFLLIGNQQQYTTYKQYCLQYKLQQEKVAAATLNADAGAEWGPWGGVNGPFWGPCFY